MPVQSRSTAGEGERLYPLYHAKDEPDENKRLDDMHEGIKEYLGNSLTFVHLEDTTPTRILDLGCGSGAWAIQAATQFPSAEVLAVDLASIPSRDLPSNLTFQELDITEPFPFPPEGFDIVHMRFVAMNLPHFGSILNRIISLVKPNGWLLLEDVDNILYDAGGLGPGQTLVWDKFHGHQKEEGVNLLAGSSFESLLKASGAFSEINVHKVAMPFSKLSNDTRVSKLSSVLQTSFRKAMTTMFEKRGEVFGITSEHANQFLEEMDDPNWDLHMDLYFTWSRKKVVGLNGPAA